MTQPMRRSTLLIAALLGATAIACDGATRATPGEPRIVDIVATDYAYQAPDLLPPGPVRFRLINKGKRDHEVQIFRFNPGLTPDSVGKLLVMEHYLDSLSDQGGSVLVTPKGWTNPSEIYVVLDTAHVWALRCEFRDTTGTPRHSQMGMVKVLRVSGRQP